ncbi:MULTISPECIES: M13 family metallopeptidase [Dyella]|uniref:M13 family peptidase n=2 Tax=Dyella TaxID=231454 RepID=A0A4R0YSR0_9GAMM|nr:MULTISPECIES: M13 family metallopeptidase [Dyella]TBR40043.1 M13 family peptidase [Dyella terrae]TCI12375.1 M13 family peptidase [Dyella soli]
MKHRIMKPLTLAVGLALATTSFAATAPSFNVKEIDTKIDACNDFNGFVNAKWVAANPIPADRTRWGSFDALRDDSLNVQKTIVESAAAGAAKAKAGSIQQKIGYLYAAGMDQAAIEKAGFDPIKPELSQIDGLKNGADVAAFITARYAQGDGMLFRFYGNGDFKDSNQQIAYVGQGGLGLPTAEYYSKPDFEKIRAAYVQHIARTLQLTGVSAADAQAQAKSVMDFETRLAAASMIPTELRLPENRYRPVTVADANKSTPHFDWSAFFKAQNADVKGIFSMSQPKFFAEVDKMLAETPVTDWQAYLRFHTIDGAAPYLSKAFVQEDFEFNAKTLNGQKEMQPLWKRTLGTVNGSMGMALGELYVAKTFSPTSKTRAEELVNNLRMAYKARIENLEWMSDATKQKALEKWASFTPKIGYPDVWRDWTGLQIQPGNYYANVASAGKFNYDFMVAKIGKPVDRNEWGMTPQTVNAYYSPQKNEIVFPAAILQSPFFDAKADDALNYGGIGAVIGHEMGHGYDDQGSKFDAQGNNVNWWTDADRKAFDERTAKLAAQFDSYEALPGKFVNGKLTMGENIGDLGGLNAAYDALQMALAKNPAEAKSKIDGYTQDQRFFLNWARVWRGNIRPEAALTLLNTDPHAPAQFRAIGAPSNMAAFAQAFQCKAGTKMVRSDDKQVKIW